MKSLIDYTDTELVTALTQSDRNAFEVIYRKYVHDLLEYARRNIAVQEECEEIVQEVFLSLWSRHQHLKIDSLRVYLFSMVKYMIVKYFQKQKVRKRYAEHYVIFEQMYDTIDDESFDTPAVIQAMIEKSLSSLPERCGVAIRLRLHENLSNADIAQRMNVTKKTVENYVVMFTAHFRSTYATADKSKIKLASFFLAIFMS